MRTHCATVPRALVGGALGASGGWVHMGVAQTCLHAWCLCTCAGAVTAPPVVWVSRTLGDRVLLERDRGPQPPQSLVSGSVGPQCRSGAPLCPSRISLPDPPSSVPPGPQQHLPPGSWRDCLMPWPLAWGLCGMATGDHGGTLGLLSAVGVLMAQGLCLPLVPVPTAHPRVSSGGKRSLWFRVCVLGRVWYHGPGTRGALTVESCPRLGHGDIRGSTCS